MTSNGTSSTLLNFCILEGVNLMESCIILSTDVVEVFNNFARSALLMRLYQSTNSIKSPNFII